MNTLDFPPAGFEVEDQLQRILASTRFRNAPNPSAFLELSVRRALKGKKTTGRIVAKALFGEDFVQGISPDVRVTAKNLRKTLQRYYAREGSSDVVLIGYPEPSEDKSLKPVEGKAYTPLFSYNPMHEVSVFLRSGYRCLERSTYRDYRRALNILSEILDRDPENLGAVLGGVETLCKFADRQWQNSAHIDGYEVCMQLFGRVENRAEHYWRFWAAKAYFYKGQGKGDLVASLYAKALSLNRIATESYLPYMEFLFDTGRTDDALGLAQRYVNERIEDSTAVAQYGLMLLAAGRIDIAVGHLEAALEMEPGNCLAHETLGAMRFVQRDLDGAAVHLHALRALCDAESFARIVATFEGAEERCQLKGCVTKLLSQPINVSSLALVKS